MVLWRAAASRTRRGNIKRSKRASRLEYQAEKLLHRSGYRVIDRQRSFSWPIEVDGERFPARMRVDLLVEKGKAIYVAEVKSGGAARATAPETRRQLLEYRLACGVDGVLLVDMENRHIHEIDFPDLWDQTKPSM